MSPGLTSQCHLGGETQMACEWVSSFGATAVQWRLAALHGARTGGSMWDAGSGSPSALGGAALQPQDV